MDVCIRNVPVGKENGNSLRQTYSTVLVGFISSTDLQIEKHQTCCLVEGEASHASVLPAHRPVSPLQCGSRSAC